VDPLTGEVPPPTPQVSFPMQNGVNSNDFDKNLPYAPKNSEATK